MLYKVTVRCFYVGPHKRARREMARTLVEAPDIGAARGVGVEFVEGNAACDKRWLAFEWVGTATVVLPKDIKSL